MEFPNESPEYRSARDRLLAKEAEERRVMEEVAVARRALPEGGLLKKDYLFDEVGESGTVTRTKMSELFAPGKNSLVIYNFMFPRDPHDDRPPGQESSTRRLKLL